VRTGELDKLTTTLRTRAAELVWSLQSGQLGLHDISRERQRQALVSTARFANECLSTAEAMGDPRRRRHSRRVHEVGPKLGILRRAIDEAPDEGLVAEFGVAGGFTLREIAARRLPAHGFDSFEGLPEDWLSDQRKGSFAQRRLPEVGGAELHVGWFEDTLPGFLAAHPEPFAFVHLDADLYLSTKTVFDLAGDRCIPGTVILFDEYFNYPGWEQHEHRAFMEYVNRTGRSFEYLAYNAVGQQLLVRITG
jgi:hypothetical protein